MALEITDDNLEIDGLGYLTDPNDWDEVVAGKLASQYQITLASGHWEIINIVRDYSNNGERTPAMATMWEVLKSRIGLESDTREYVADFFPIDTISTIYKISGLRPVDVSMPE